MPCSLPGTYPPGTWACPSVPAATVTHRAEAICGDAAVCQAQAEACANTQDGQAWSFPEDALPQLQACLGREEDPIVQARTP